MKNNRINVQQRLETALTESAEHYRAGTQIMRELIDMLEYPNPPNSDPEFITQWAAQKRAKIKQAEVWLAD